MLLSTIFMSIIIPIQVHPLSQGHWQRSHAPIVQATIDAAKIIGIAKMHTPSKVRYINELHTGPIYRVHPRKVFIREYVSPSS
jgi:hypothetical protein